MVCKYPLDAGYVPPGNAPALAVGALGESGKLWACVPHGDHDRGVADLIGLGGRVHVPRALRAEPEHFPCLSRVCHRAEFGSLRRQPRLDNLDRPLDKPRPVSNDVVHVPGLGLAEPAFLQLVAHLALHARHALFCENPLGGQPVAVPLVHLGHDEPLVWLRAG